MNCPGMDTGESRRRPRRGWQMALLCAWWLGCSPYPNVVPVTGRVLQAGKPVPDLLVIFQPETGRSSTGRTNAEGRFTLQYTETVVGAELGEHRVWLRYDPPPNSTAWKIDGTVETPAELEKLLAQFGHPTASPLRVTVTRGMKPIDLALDYPTGKSSSSASGAAEDKAHPPTSPNLRESSPDESGPTPP